MEVLAETGGSCTVKMDMLCMPSGVAFITSFPPFFPAPVMRRPARPVNMRAAGVVSQ